MIQPLIHDPILLSRVSRPATADDLPVVQDLLDTINAHRDTCAGMAANMIGQTTRIIVFDCDGTWMVMLNPELIKTVGVYDTQESCLSLLGAARTTQRYQKIKVRYQNTQLQIRLKTFEGWTAQVIQHEIDHCNGILI